MWHHIPGNKNLYRLGKDKFQLFATMTLGGRILLWGARYLHCTEKVIGKSLVPRINVKNFKLGFVLE
jgi:hypothetical protein